jgi:exodeoxyribonuclease VII small subunit
MTQSPERAAESVQSPPDTLTFDEAYAELQRAVEALETGGQPLEEAIALHERAAALLARCDKLLGEAELRVRQLVAARGGALEARDVRPGEAAEADPPAGG